MEGEGGERHGRVSGEVGVCAVREKQWRGKGGEAGQSSGAGRRGATSNSGGVGRDGSGASNAATGLGVT